MNVIGVIGTGEIGWRIGKRLLQGGHQVIGYDVRPDALIRPKASGFTIAGSIAELCRSADLVLSCVSDGSALRSVVTGPSGVAANLVSGTPYIDLTSAEPWITIGELAPLLGRMGIPFLDAPASGGVLAAESGRMNFMVGGDAGLLDRCRPVLTRLGSVITHVGSIGSGHALNIINMLAFAGSVLSTSELVTVGMATGYSLDQLIGRLELSKGASYCTRVHFPRFIVPGNYASGYSFDLMLKDLTIGIGLADRCGIPLFLTQTAYDIYRAAAKAGLSGKDNTRIVEHMFSVMRDARYTEARSDFVARIEILAAACNMLVGAEAICLGAAAGFSAESVIDALSEGSGDTRALSHDLAEYLRNVGMPISLANIPTAALPVIAQAREAFIPVPLLKRMVDIYVAAISRFGENADNRMVLNLMAERTSQGGALEMKADLGETIW